MAMPAPPTPPAERHGWAIKQRGEAGKVSAELMTWSEGELADDEARAPFAAAAASRAHRHREHARAGSRNGLTLTRLAPPARWTCA
jgi:hypothetical protein